MPQNYWELVLIYEGLGTLVQLWWKINTLNKPYKQWNMRVTETYFRRTQDKRFGESVFADRPTYLQCHLKLQILKWIAVISWTKHIVDNNVPQQKICKLLLILISESFWRSLIWGSFRNLGASGFSKYPRWKLLKVINIFRIIYVIMFIK